MGFRFRKSFKVAPGVKINLGKKSAGVSFGGKGGGISFNTRSGARARVSIPGTGISYSTKPGGKSRRKSRSSSRSRRKSNSSAHKVNNTQYQQQQNTSYIRKMQKCQTMAQKYNLTSDSAAKRQTVFIISTVALFVIAVLTSAYTICSLFTIAGCVTWYYAVQFGRIKDYLKHNPSYNSSYQTGQTSTPNNISYTHSSFNNSISITQEQILNLDYPIADFQWDFVRGEVEKLNSLLKTVECTKNLHMDSNALTSDSYFRYNPFTPKTKKISKYPCMLFACSAVYLGYSASIFYGTDDHIGKGQIQLATKDTSYFIDFKYLNGTLTITKVTISNDSVASKVIYHI